MAPPPDCGFRDRPFEALPGIGSLDRGEETVTDKDISDRTGNWRGITVHDLVLAYVFNFFFFFIEVAFIISVLSCPPIWQGRKLARQRTVSRVERLGS